MGDPILSKLLLRLVICFNLFNEEEVKGIELKATDTIVEVDGSCYPLHNTKTLRDRKTLIDCTTQKMNCVFCITQNDE